MGDAARIFFIPSGIPTGTLRHKPGVADANWRDYHPGNEHEGAVEQIKVLISFTDLLENEEAPDEVGQKAGKCSKKGENLDFLEKIGKNWRKSDTIMENIEEFENKSRIRKCPCQSETRKNPSNSCLIFFQKDRASLHHQANVILKLPIAC